jgi:hypothetical protein
MKKLIDAAIRNLSTNSSSTADYLHQITIYIHICHHHRPSFFNRLIAAISAIRAFWFGPATAVKFGPLGYVPMADLGAEFLFQVIAERAEKATVILTTNLPFSEWTQAIPNAHLCKALLDRITDRAHIIETGADSFRFRRTVEKGSAKTTG